MRNEIEKAMVAIESGEDTAHGRFIFPPGMQAFKGHFPGRPLLPGVMQIEMVRATAEKAFGKNYEISSIRKAKFTGECLPGDEIAVSVTLKSDSEGVKARGIVESRGKTCADIKLLLKDRD
jgi:3-hydroxyacyl-[acyl-carrier-protein] dehydratase